MKFDTPSSRAKLPARVAPYYSKIHKEVHLGYRKRTADSAGQWVVRYGNGSSIPYVTNSMGDFLEHRAEARWEVARTEALAWASEQAQSVGLEVKSPSRMITVAEACRRWLAHWREQGRNDFGLNRDQRVLERFVYAHPIGAVSLDRLTAEMLVRWRRDLATAPVTGKKVGKEAVAAGGKRSASTVNRNLDPLRGALSLAHREGMKVNRVWHEALAKTKHVVGRRDEYLDIGQRRALLDACPADAAKFFKGLCLLPFRPGAMAHLTVGQFDTRLRRLHVGKDKAGANRYVTLPPDTAEFFTEQCKGKLPSACIFMQANGRPFDNQTWWKTFRDAAAVAKLPAKACTYTLRHSTITDLLTLHKLDIYTVADLAGTSPEQIRDHYRHVLQGHAEDALAKLALGLLKSPHMAEKS